MELSIKIDKVCDWGNHVYLTVTKNGAGNKQFLMALADFHIEPDEYEIVLMTLIRNRIKTLGYNAQTPLATLKTAIESEVFKL